MSVENTVKALRQCANEVTCNGCAFSAPGMTGDCRENMMIAAADQLERLNDFEQSQCVKLLEKITALESENERLKVGQPVTCGECVHYEVSTMKDVNSHCGLVSGGIYGRDLKSWDYCSLGRRETE